MSQSDKLFYLPHTEESFPTPRTRENIFHTTKPLKISKPKHYDEQMARLKAKGNLDGHHFDSAEELGMFLDFYNDTQKKSAEKHAHNEIFEISKYLAKSIGRSYHHL